MFTENCKNLEENNKFVGSEALEFPTVLMYTYFMLGWHYFFQRDFEKALEYSIKCEKHTPTFIENIILQAKCLKRLHRCNQASSKMQQYYKVDKADRYLINKTVKYMLRNGEVQEADTLFKTFMFRHENVEETLHSLQKIWYERSMATALAR